MAPLIFARDDGSDSNNALAFYLFITFIIFFAAGFMSMIFLAAMRRIKRSRQSQDLEASASASKSHRRSRHPSTISIVNEKSAFLDDEPYSPTSVPEIRITFPEEQGPDGKRQSRVVVVTIGEKGSVGYAPYQEPLPVYKEKESPQFKSLDLERIGGLKEKDEKP